MSESDPIVAEVRRIRDAHAAKFNYDIGAIFEDMRRRQAEGGRPLYDAPAPLPRVEPPAKAG